MWFGVNGPNQDFARTQEEGLWNTPSWFPSRGNPPSPASAGSSPRNARTTDGLYTHPTDEALRFDVEGIKAWGFNMVRKHIKVESRRWFAQCDRAGLLVWQDMPSTFKSRTEEEKAQFESELSRMVRTHWNSPSVVNWIVFNEHWGAYDVERLTNFVMALDPSRLITGNSGIDAGKPHLDYQVGHIIDNHHYRPPTYPFATSSRAAVNGEYGAIGYLVDGHVWDRDGPWVHYNYKGKEDATAEYEKFAGQLLEFKKVQMLSGAVYTQWTDVENEMNGLYTYDRKVEKLDRTRVAAANRSLWVDDFKGASHTLTTTTVNPTDGGAEATPDEGKKKRSMVRRQKSQPHRVQLRCIAKREISGLPLGIQPGFSDRQVKRNCLGGILYHPDIHLAHPAVLPGIVRHKGQSATPARDNRHHAPEQIGTPFCAQWCSRRKQGGGDANRRVVDLLKTVHDRPPHDRHSPSQQLRPLIGHDPPRLDGHLQHDLRAIPPGAREVHVAVRSHLRLHRAPIDRNPPWIRNTGIRVTINLTRERMPLDPAWHAQHHRDRCRGSRFDLHRHAALPRELTVQAQRHRPGSRHVNRGPAADELVDHHCALRGGQHPATDARDETRNLRRAAKQITPPDT